MSTSSPDRGDPGEHTLWARAGHHGSVIIIAIIAYAVASGLVRTLVGMPDWVATAEVPLPFVLAYAFAAEYRHDRSVCGRCVAAWPVDGDDRARRRIGYLRYYHAIGSRPIRALATLLAVLAAAYLGIRFVGPGLLSVLMALAVPAISLWWLVVVHIHQRLRPWCPWCRRRRDDETTPAPTPDPSNTNTPT